MLFILFILFNNILYKITFLTAFIQKRCLKDTIKNHFYYSGSKIFGLCNLFGIEIMMMTKTILMIMMYWKAFNLTEI